MSTSRSTSSSASARSTHSGGSNTSSNALKATLVRPLKLVERGRLSCVLSWPKNATALTTMVAEKARCTLAEEKGAFQIGGAAYACRSIALPTDVRYLLRYDPSKRGYLLERVTDGGATCVLLDPEKQVMPDEAQPHDHAGDQIRAAQVTRPQPMSLTEALLSSPSAFAIDKKDEQQEEASTAAALVVVAEGNSNNNFENEELGASTNNDEVADEAMGSNFADDHVVGNGIGDCGTDDDDLVSGSSEYEDEY